MTDIWKKYQKNTIIVACVIVIAFVLLLSRNKFIEVQIREQMELGQKYLTELNYEQAVIAFRKVIELDEKNTDAYKALADALKHSGSIDESGQVYQTLLDLYLSENKKKDAADLLVAEGNMYLEEGDYTKALNCFKRLQELDPGNEEGYIGEAKVYEARGDVLQAISIISEGYKKVDSISSVYEEYTLSLFELARKLPQNAFKREDNQKAVHYGSEVLEKEPGNTRLKKLIRQLEAKSVLDENFISYEDIKINGRLVSETVLEDWIAEYPSYEDDFHNPRLSDYSYFPTQRLQGGSIIGNLKVYCYEGSNKLNSAVFTKKNEGHFRIPTGESVESIPSVFEPNVRGIQMGDSLNTVLEKLGIHDNFIEKMKEYDTDPEFYVSIEISDNGVDFGEASNGAKETMNLMWDISTEFSVGWPQGVLQFGFNESGELVYLELFNW